MELRTANKPTSRIGVDKGSATMIDRSDPRDAGFAVVTKLVVLIAVAASLSFVDGAWFSVGLTVPLLGYMAVGKRPALARILLVYYVALFALYLAMAQFGMRLAIFSPVHVFMAWKAFPTIIAVVALVTTPPGMISSFLAKLHFPKKVILGVLVIFRFFPTMSYGIRRLKDALRNRGLLSPAQVLGNPLDTLEYLLVPTMMTLINSADQLASSAVTRAAEAPTKRTSYYRKPLRVPDFLCMLFFVALGVLLVWISYGGAR